MPKITASTNTDKATSTQFQLALLAALSSATVVAKVSPLTLSSVGGALIKLMITNTATLYKNNQMQKYKKLIVAN